MKIIEFLVLLLPSCFFFLFGGIPLFALLRIKKDGIRTKAEIFNVTQVSKAGTRDPGEYSAAVRFRIEGGRVIQAHYSSSGDYLTLFQNNENGVADVIYSETNPNKFYLPKDKGNIGWSVICAAVGLIGIIGTALAGWRF